MTDRKLRYISLFSGIEAVSVALDGGPWEPVAFCEIDRFPSEVLAYHWPDVPNLGDITKVDWTPYVDKVDVVFGGSPCFVGGSLVMTVDGPKPIEDIRVGDMVLTHRNRWRKVTAVGHKTADTITVKGQGSTGIECTPNHPFWSCRKEYSWDNDKRMDVPHLTDPSWVEARNLKGAMWLNAGEAEDATVMESEPATDGSRIRMTPEVAYMVGRYLGDGCVYIKGNYHSTIIVEGYDKADLLGERLRATGLRWSRGDRKSTVAYACSDKRLAYWLRDNFGHLSLDKQVPGWCLSMDVALRRAVFDGYMDSDGCVTANGWKATTVSRKLFVGMKMLAASLGYATSVTHVHNRRPYVEIEGRRVNEHDQWSFNVYDRSRSAVVCPQGFWGLVRKVLPGRQGVTVYNLTVDEDHSYTVDGVVVKIVSHSLRPEKGRVSKVNQDSCSSTFDAFVRCVLDGSSGRTSRARSQASTGSLSDSSCPKWTRSGMVWHGEYWMRSSSVWPSDASVCSLSEALEPCVPRRYYLSAKACRGIIRRAETRGKPLPENLRAALENQIAALEEEEGTEAPATEDA